MTSLCSVLEGEGEGKRKGELGRAGGMRCRHRLTRELRGLWAQNRNRKVRQSGQQGHRITEPTSL